MNMTSADCELHRDFSQNLKESYLYIVQQLRKTLKQHKEQWKHKPEELKKQIKDAQDCLDKEKQKFKSFTTQLDNTKKERDEQYKKHNINKEYAYEKMPKKITKLETQTADLIQKCSTSQK